MCFDDVAHTCSLLGVTKLYKKDTPAPTMLRDLEKIHNTLESRAACQIRRDVLQRNLEKGFDHDLTRRQRITASDLDGCFHIRTLQVTSPLRTRSRIAFVNCTAYCLTALRISCS